MNLLLIGSGGREHALAWLISKSPMLNQLFCVPGNPGTSEIAKNIPGDIKDFATIGSVVKENNIDIVVVGPEDPLVNGLRDFFEEDDLLKDVLFVGPDRRGAMLEGSKDFAKEFMVRHHIPTARFRTFKSGELEQAYRFLETLEPPYVLKADGLAAGKGVLILNTMSDAIASLKDMFSGKFGDAGSRVVIEEYLTGIEASAFVLTDGDSYILLPEAKDYKRIGEGDTGLNTGGMGAVSPVPFFDDQFRKKVVNQVVIPTIEGLKEEGINYKGFIFIGLMNCNGDPYVIEYNVRMGDPETEVVVRRIESDFLSHLKASAMGTLKDETINISSSTAMGVIAVSGGYPEQYMSGYEIKGVEDLDETMLFHAGTAHKEGTLITKGGRVVALTALADSLAQARETIYDQITRIHYQDMYYRKDIGLDLLDDEK